MEALIKMIPVIMVFSIPLSAIFGAYYYKIKKLQYDNKQEDADIDALKRQMMYLEAEQERLQTRVQQLEGKAQGYAIPDEQLIREDKEKHYRL